MDNAEKIAKTLVEVIYLGAEMRYRPDQSRGEYDYDLRYSDGTIAAVEVTASRDQAVEETMAVIFKKDFLFSERKV